MSGYVDRLTQLREVCASKYAHYLLIAASPTIVRTGCRSSTHDWAQLPPFVLTWFATAIAL